MSKRILVIDGSPRPGKNTDRLCDAFIQGAEAALDSVAEDKISNSSHYDTLISKIGQYRQHSMIDCHKKPMTECMAPSDSVEGNTVSPHGCIANAAIIGRGRNGELHLEA